MRLFRSKTSRPRRRWWQVAVRSAVLVAALLTAAYATLPYWAPTGVLRRWLAREMSAQMGVPVSIREATLSWSDGLELRGLTIDAPDGEGAMVRADAVRMDFSPADLFRRRVAWMEVVRPRLFVRWDASGRCSIDPLRRLKFDVLARQISVDGAEAIIEPPGADEPVLLKVGSLEVRSGRTGQFAHVALTGRLVQPGDDAPVSMQFTQQPVAPAARASASLDFDGVALERLALCPALNLPLRRLAGRCSGSLQLQLTRTGLVDPVAVTLEIAGLDAQPKKGPDLPVIEQAGIELTGTIDPLAESDRIRIDLSDVTVRVPGIDLSGQASILAGAGVRVQQAAARGTVDPQRLTALLTGMDSPSDPLHFAGPVRIETFTLQREGPVAHVELAIDATQATVRAAGRVYKPVGNRLSMRLDAVLDERRGQLQLSNVRVELGDAWIEHDGRYTGVLAAAGRLPTEGLRALLGVDVVRSAGRWYAADLAAVRNVWPALAPLQVDGAASGDWQYVGRPGGHGHFEAGISSDAASALTLGAHFIKPSGSALHVNASGRIVRRGDPRHDLDTDVHVEKLDLTVGAGRLHTDGLTLRVRAGANGRPTAAISGKGRFDVTSLQSLLACLPTAAETATVRGSLPTGGRYVIEGVDGRAQGRLEADLTPLDIAAEDLLDKPRGAPAALMLDATLAPHGNGQGNAVLTMRPEARSGEAADDKPAVRLHLAGKLSTAAERFEWRPGALQLDLHDADARWLARRLPALRPPAHLPEGLRVNGRVRHAFATPATVAVTAEREEPLRLTLGDSHLAASGTVTLARSSDLPAGSLDALRHVDVTVTGRLHTDDVVRTWPTARKLLASFGIDGTLRDISMALRGDGRALQVEAGADATALAARLDVGVRKPSGLPAEVSLVADVHDDLRTIDLRTFHARAGGVRLSASGSARWDGGAERAHMLQAVANASVTADDAATLEPLLPTLADGNLGGGIQADIAWRLADGRMLRELTLTADALTGRYGGKAFGLDGAATLYGLRLPDGDAPARVARARTDGLHVRFGNSRGWLMGDVQAAARGPTGQVRLLAPHVDAAEVGAWLGAAFPEQRDHEAPPRQRARDVIAAMRDRLDEADLDVSAHVRALRYHDASVNETYTVRQVNVHGSASKGLCTLSYATGLSGGLLSGKLAVDLSDAEPVVHSDARMRELIVTEEVQPHINQYFPGNDVSGQFSRTEQTQVPLVELLAGRFGADDAAHPTGTARNVAVEGTVTGQAAPAFITDIFPKLDLATYRYERMTGFAELHADGSATNDMVFDGRVYDLYIDGRTDADHIGHYEIGVILPPGIQSAEWNHAHRLGRIPVLKFRARIEGGKMHDVKVSYLRPDEIVAAILLWNNPLYVALSSGE